MNIQDSLLKMGLTEYESKAYTVLVEQGHLSAKQISETTGIPYSKIYSTLISLIDKGWISIKEGRPKRYRPVEPTFASGIAVRKQTQELNDAMNIINDTLQSIYKVDTGTGRSEIWSIRGYENVLKKFSEIIRSCRHEAFCLALNLDDNDSSQADLLIRGARERGCRVVAVHKRSPLGHAHQHRNSFMLWESSHQITGKGIFLFADARIMFLCSLDDKAVALWSNDPSLVEVIRNIISLEKLEQYSNMMLKKEDRFYE